MKVTCLTRSELPALAADLARAMPELGETEQQIALEIYRLLADGKPVLLERLATRVGLLAEEVSEVLGDWPGVYRDGQGDVIGFWGLTLVALLLHQSRPIPLRAT
jgi:alkylmercury lyase